MANPEHVELVKQGAEVIRRWREEHPDTVLDLCGANLDLINLRGANLAGARLTKASLAGTNLVLANLAGAYLDGATLIKTSLASADLQGAFMHNADLAGANLDRAKLSGAYLLGANLTKAHLFRADLTKARLDGAGLGGALLFEADLTEAFLLTAILTRAEFRWANLFRTQLHGVVGAHRARSLETVRFTLPAGTHTPNPVNDASERDAREFDTCLRPWPERWVDWEFLRGVGRLPLFGISYTALILIPIVFYGLALYNENIELVRAWAQQIGVLPDFPLHRFAPLILDRLHPRPIPSLSFVLLVSTFLLAVGSTLYTFFCPSRIKEFSRDQWCDRDGHSLLHYWPLAWKHRYIRLTCAACYALGGVGVAWVLGSKVWHTALFIVKHSTWPWPWR